MDPSWIQTQWDKVEHFFGNDDFNIHVYGTFMVSFIVYWSIGLLYTFVDVTGKPKFMLKYRVQSNVKSYPISKAQLVDLLAVVITNEALVIPLSILAFKLNQWNGRIFQHELPDIFTSIFSIFFFLMVWESSTYYSHRLLHHPFMYKKIHMKHHTWVSPIAIAATYAHPVEHILLNMLPVILGPSILKSHLVLLWIWISWVTFEGLTIHSGFHLPGLMSPEFHDFHHLKFNYNYGTTGWLDWFHGTDSLFRKSKEFKRHKTLWTTTPLKISLP